jgi:hypothetical protein
MAKRKPKTLAQLSQDAAKLMQRIVRIKASVHAGEGGYINCVSCGKNDHWSNMQGGHFISRTSTRWRYDERNIHPQCPSCNLYKSGNLIPDTLYMEEMYGTEFVTEMIRSRSEPIKMVRADLMKDIVELRGELKALELQADFL